MSQELDIVGRLRHIEDLLAALVKAHLSNVITKELNDPKMKKLYSLTGDYTIRELERKIGLPRSSISKVWQRWESLGLLIKEGKTYRKVL